MQKKTRGMRKKIAMLLMAGLLFTTTSTANAKEEYPLELAIVAENENMKEVQSNSDFDSDFVFEERKESISDQSEGVKINAYGGVAPTVLDSKYMDFDSNYSKTIFCEKRNGIFFINPQKDSFYSNSQNYDIYFYSLDHNTYTKALSVNRAESVYADDLAFYTLNCTISTPETPIVRDNTSYSHSITYTVTKYEFATGKSTKIEYKDAGFSNAKWANYIQAFGYDSLGRLYVADQDEKLSVYNASGKLLSYTTLKGWIGRFFGFDTVSGNFYFEGSYNWVYWGYDHNMDSMMCGNLSKDNKLTVPYANLSILNQSYFFEHKNSCRMLNDKYFACLTTFSNDTLMLMNSNVYDVNDYTQQSTSISIMDSSVSVSPINISDTSVIQMAVSTQSSTYENCLDQSSEGTRCSLSADGKMLLVKTGSNCLTEYDISAKKKLYDIQTTYPAYNFQIMGNKCVVLERKDKTFYVEQLNMQTPTDFTVSAPSSMKVGDTAKVTASTGNNFSMDYTFVSSNAKIVSVDIHGKLIAWNKGNATITVTAKQLNKSKTVTIQVNDSSKGSGTFTVTNTKGTASETIHNNSSYKTYGSIESARLSQEENGTYQRVEYIGSKVVIEQFDSNFQLKSKKEIKPELKLYGGYYSGTQYNFLVFGAENENDQDSVEVFRVVKYDKSWNRVGVCSIKGENTNCPFEAGSLDMTELNGMLYVYTCHTMYKSEDGYNHQSNCTFKIQEKDMKVVDSFTGVMNISMGYVSHSFNQKIKTDGKTIYRVDHGDAYPRGICITMTDVAEEITNPHSYGTIMKIPGAQGNNYTGYCLGDFGVTDGYVLVAGSGIIDQDKKRRNIWVTNVDLETGEVTSKWLTKYAESSKCEISVPKLVQINANQFLIMWEENTMNTEKYITKTALLTPDGQLASNVYELPFALSSCDPIVDAKGNVVWYITNNGAPTFISINPYRLGDIVTGVKDPTNKDAVNSAKYAAGEAVTVSKVEYRIQADGTAEYVVAKNKKATSINVPASVKVNGKTYKVTAVADNAFSGNKYLKKVVIGANVKRIGNNAFNGCKKLKTVTFVKKSACSTIGDKAFYKCVSLTKFTIPSKVSKIGNYAFYGCKKLKKITVQTKKLKDKKIGTKAFGKISSKAKIKVPAKCYKSYKKILKKKGLPKKATVKK